MSVLKVVNFGGLIPRVSPRALPADAAQTHKNLLATSSEFRPLAADKDIGIAVAGAKTLYRLPRNADGTIRTDDATGWIAEAADKSYVAGQLNDDATARTTVAWNDGTQPPRVIDSTGADRLLGVPAPAKPTTAVTATSQFTREQATGWVAETLIPAMAAALKAALYEDEQGSRIYSGLPVAGPTSLHGATHDTATPWFVYYTMTTSQAAELGLDAIDLGGEVVGTDIRLRIETLPYWGTVRTKATLEAAIRLIENPKDGSQLFTDARISQIADDLMAEFDPNGASIKAMRSEIEAAAKEFNDALNAPLPSIPTLPTPPVKPTTPEYTVDVSGA